MEDTAAPVGIGYNGASSDQLAGSRGFPLESSNDGGMR
jgi:hypothetical protein